MYHYVWEIKNSIYPRIKGLEFSKFKKQLDYLEKNFNIISPKDFLKKKFPEKSCLLTFDDGLKDHINYVFPELIKRKLKGFFFPPAAPIVENNILDVHAIHYILATYNNDKDLVNMLDTVCIDLGISEADLKKYKIKYLRKTNAYDPKERTYFKRMLQHVLPLEKRKTILKFFFENKLNISINDFSKNFYMNKEDLLKLTSEEMYLGSHGYKHYWLEKLNYKEQEKDINLSLEFLKEVGLDMENWVMCYPFGSFNSDTIKILNEKKCVYGFTTKEGVADTKMDNLTLPRVDTNELPQN